MGNANISEVIKRADLQGVKNLLAEGLDIQGRFLYEGGNDHRPNPLEFAVLEGKTEIVAILLERGADVNARGGFYTALQHAVLAGHLSIVDLLIKAGADVNAERGPEMYNHYSYLNTWGYVPTHENPNAHEDFVNSAVALGVPRPRHETALSIATELGRVEMIQILLNGGGDPCSSESNTINTAVVYGRAEMLSKFLDHAQISESNAVSRLPTTYSPLHIAIYYGKADILDILLQWTGTALVNSQDAEGLTPLHYAVRNDSDRIVQTPIRHGAPGDVMTEWIGTTLANSRDPEGLTPLNYVVGNDSDHIFQALIGHGARGDIPDFSNSTTAFELSLLNYTRHPNFALLVYPTSRGRYPPASKWKRLMQVDSTANLEITKSHFRVLDNRLYEDAFNNRYPFPTSQKNSQIFTMECAEMRIKRILILGNSDILRQALTGFHCRWWVRDTENQWKVQSATMPSRLHISQSASGRGFFECYFTVKCLAFPQTENEWPVSLNTSLPLDSIANLWKAHGIGWVMFKNDSTETENGEERNPLQPLASTMFFSTSEYTQLPQFASSLFIPLLDKLKEEWELNFKRTKLLLASGDNPRLIKDLLWDALLWDELKNSAESQVRELHFLGRAYTGMEMQMMREEDEETTNIAGLAFKNSVEILSDYQAAGLASLKETSSELIQLEFNLSSINEAQKSRSTNLSMKRLSWITFIFLPLTFISSLFGMNIDILEANVAWWIYIPFAFVTLGLTMFIWLIFKYNRNLEEHIEDKFKRSLRFLSQKKASVEKA